MPNTCGIVLAGGASRRFGAPKCLAKLGGKPLIQRVLDEQRRVVELSCIVANDNRLFESLGTEIVRDLIPTRGPAGGMHAGLVWAEDRRATGIWCSPCDAALLEASLGTLLIDRSRGADAVLPLSDGHLGYEPLFGWYSVGLRDLFEQRLEAAPPPMHEIVSAIPKVEYVTSAEISAAGCGPNIFSNINTRNDLAAARRKLGS